MIAENNAVLAMLAGEGLTFHAKYTATSEKKVKSTESVVVVRAAPRAPPYKMAATYAATARGTTGAVNHRTHPGRSAAIRMERLTDTISLAKPAKIKMARNGAAGANACPSTRVAMAGDDPAIRAAKGRSKIVNFTASCATSRARSCSPSRMV